MCPLSDKSWNFQLKYLVNVKIFKKSNVIDLNLFDSFYVDKYLFLTQANLLGILTSKRVISISFAGKKKKKKNTRIWVSTSIQE